MKMVVYLWKRGHDQLSPQLCSEVKLLVAAA